MFDVLEALEVLEPLTFAGIRSPCYKSWRCCASKALDVLEALTIRCDTLDVLEVREVLAPLEIRNHTFDGVESAGSDGSVEIRCEMFDVLEDGAAEIR